MHTLSITSGPELGNPDGRLTVRSVVGGGGDDFSGMIGALSFSVRSLREHGEEESVAACDPGGCWTDNLKAKGQLVFLIPNVESFGKLQGVIKSVCGQEPKCLVLEELRYTPSACHRSILFFRKLYLFFFYKSTTGTKVKE